MKDMGFHIWQLIAIGSLLWLLLYYKGIQKLHRRWRRQPASRGFFNLDYKKGLQALAFNTPFVLAVILLIVIDAKSDYFLMVAVVYWMALFIGFAMRFSGGRMGDDYYFPLSTIERLKRLRNGEIKTEEFRRKYKRLQPRARKILAGVEDYLNDHARRSTDEEFRAWQNTQFDELLRLIDCGASSAEIMSITFRRTTRSKP